MSMEIERLLLEYTMLNQNALLDFTKKSPYKYKRFFIKKHNGGSREIAQPTKALKLIQKFLVKNLRDILPVHFNATAYEKGRSILANAKMHINSNYIMKLDFSDFFHSITPESLFYRLESHCAITLSEKDKFYLTNIFFWKKSPGKVCLSIGAPSSPFLSNAILFAFDQFVNEWCKKNSLCYTRYADDITIGGKKPIDTKTAKSIVQQGFLLVKFANLTLNERKTCILSKKDRRQVTGLIITNNRDISIGRKKKRAIKSMVHHGLSGQLSQEECAELRGHLANIKDVDRLFYAALEKKYTIQSIESLFNK